MRLNFGWGEVGDVGSWMMEKMGVEEIVIGGWKVDEGWGEILRKFGGGDFGISGVLGSV